MVYIIGGYILTIEQVTAFADRNKFEIPGFDATTAISNQWLRAQGVPYRLLAAKYEGQTRIVLITRATHRNDETKHKFTPFSERPEDQVVKAKMVEWDDRLKDVKYATVADPYNDTSSTVYLVGGYILTFEQVFAFADRNKFEIPAMEIITVCSNRWLKSQGVPYRLLAASYKGQPRIVLITRATHRNDETKYKFTPFPERPEDQVVKAKMVEWDDRLKDVEYATVADPYNVS
jgi:mRNA-degrading endonuclease RelE of RelBE toxin-antitoxin system